MKLKLFLFSCPKFTYFYYAYYSFNRQKNDARNSKSRSVTPSPEREIPKEPVKPDIEPEEILETTVDKPSEEELLEKEREFQEQERLRREVANLESSIQPGVVVNRELLQRKGGESDSSATDASEDEAVEDEIPKDESSDDALKKQLLERLKQKQAEEESKLASSKPSSDNESSPSVDQTKQAQQKVNEDAGMEDQEEDFGVVDMFAESGDEKEEKSNSDVVAAEGEKATGEAEKTEAAEIEKVVRKENDEVKPEGDEVKPEGDEVIGDIEQNDSEEQQEVKEETTPGESNVDTLKSLAEIRNRMGEMSREELEEALKNLPSKGNEMYGEDGRTTPVHLRDLVVPFKSLTEFVDNKRVLYKQVFRTINKKQFKRMLPKYLRVGIF